MDFGLRKRSRLIFLALFTVLHVHALFGERETGNEIIQATEEECGLNVICRENSVWSDSCNRRCVCWKDRHPKCYRIRKEFTSMPISERRRYIQALKKASTTEPFRSKYRTLIHVHHKEFFKGIHTVDQFLPWHRWFVLEYENLLRQVDCRITVPYWDWSMRSHDPWNTTHLWNSDYGIGGNGDKISHCVRNGPFAYPDWKLSFGECLQRKFNGNPPDAVAVEHTLRAKEFKNFEFMLHVNLHNTVHCLIDGTMCTTNSAEAPEFFFHHGFIDKIWGDWQNKSKQHKEAHFSNMTDLMNGILNGNRHAPKDLIDLDNQPGCVHVKYAEPSIQGAWRTRMFLKGLTLTELGQLHRSQFNIFSRTAAKVFHLSKEDERKAEEMGKQLSIGVTNRILNLRTKLEKSLGFKLS